MLDIQNPTGQMPLSIIRPLKTAALVLVGLIVLIVLWAIYAPLSTTIRASGTLVSAKPSYDLQSPYGGAISSVHVAEQQTVVRGQLLFQLSVETKQQHYAELQAQLKNLIEENLVIDQVLKTQHSHVVETDVIHPEIMQLEKQWRLQKQTLEQDYKSKVSQINIAAQGLKILQTRKQKMQDRATRMQALFDLGSASKTQLDDQIEQVLVLKSQENSIHNQLEELQGEADQTHLKNDSLDTQFRLDLLQRSDRNLTQINDYKKQSIALKAEIDAAVIRSPIDGVVVAMGFDTDQMFAPRGSTLITLAEPLSTPNVELLIPTQAIDQTHLGMSGKVSIPSLPQRNTPVIRVTLEAISPDAIKDENDQPMGYIARAIINKDDLETLSHAFQGQLRLANDMPVSLTLTGRTTTFYQYLISPFFTIFKDAFQD